MHTRYAAPIDCHGIRSGFNQPPDGGESALLAHDDIQDRLAVSVRLRNAEGATLREIYEKGIAACGVEIEVAGVADRCLAIAGTGTVTNGLFELSKEALQDGFGVEEEICGVAGVSRVMTRKDCVL